METPEPVFSREEDPTDKVIGPETPEEVSPLEIVMGPLSFVVVPSDDRETEPEPELAINTEPPATGKTDLPPNTVTSPPASDPDMPPSIDTKPPSSFNPEPPRSLTDPPLTPDPEISDKSEPEKEEESPTESVILPAVDVLPVETRILPELRLALPD
jgi:hypothetical protein